MARHITSVTLDTDAVSGFIVNIVRTLKPTPHAALDMIGAEHILGLLMHSSFQWA